MKLLISTKLLLSALHRLSGVVPKGAAAKIGTLGCVLIDTGPDLGDPTISGTDTHTSAQVVLPGCEVEEDGAVLVELAKLLPVIESCPGEDVRLTSRGDRLSVVSGAFRATCGLQALDSYPTLPQVPAADPVPALALFPALHRAVSLGHDKTEGREGCLWQVKAENIAVASVTRKLGSWEDVYLGEEHIASPDVPSGRLMPGDWSILSKWAGPDDEILHDWAGTSTYWGSDYWHLWFRVVEHPMSTDLESYRKGFSGGEGAEVSPESLAALRRACDAVSGAVTNGRDAVLILAGGPDGFELRALFDESAIWTDKTPIPKIDWKAGSAENLLKSLAAIGEKDGPITLSMLAKGDGLRLERGGLVCLVAGYR